MRSKTPTPNSKRDHAALAAQYVADVLSGAVPAGPWVRKAAQRHLDDLARTDDLFYFEPEKGARVCRYIELLPHTKGKWAAKREMIRLEPWQCFLLVVGFGWLKVSDGTRRFRVFYWEIPRKNGKALAVDTPIATTRGWKPHGDLVPGDFVFSPSGEPVRVEAVTPHYDGPCMRVSVGDSTIIAHEAHEWETERTWFTGRSRGRRAPEALPPVETRRMAETLTGGARGDFVHRIPVARALQLPEVELPIAPYVLGAWLGDGSSSGGGITNMDPEVTDRIIELGEPCRPMSKRGRATMFSLSTGTRSQKDRDSSVRVRLRALGVLNAKRIPGVYLRASIEQRRELLRGIIDTDGHISKAGQVEIVSISAHLALDYMELLRSLGAKPSMTIDEAKLNGRFVSLRFRIMFFAFDDEPLAYIARKVERQRAPRAGKRRSNARTVTAVEPVGDRTVNCIQVEGGLYLAGESLVTTHNSLLAGGIGNYMFTSDGEFGAEVYSGATTEAQAWEVFGPARLMMDRTPAFAARLGVEVCAKTMIVPKNGSKFLPIIGNPGDGASPSCAIVDEFHEHDTPALYNTMETGMGSREQPLLLAITTAGTNIAGPCHDLHDDVCKMLDGVLENDDMFGVVFGCDVEDDWASPASLIKANPNYGVSVKEEFLLSQQRQALHSPVKQAIFKTKHLNVWTSVMSGAFNMQLWTLGADRLMSIEEFKGTECWFGVDLASKSDLCALQIIFKKTINGLPHYYWFAYYWLPEAAIEEEGPNKASYVKWREMGLLTQTDGATVDFARITEEVLSLAKILNPVEIVYDPFNATQMAQAFMEKNLEVVEFIQQPQNFAVPMDEVSTALRDGRLHHDGNEMTAWCMSNVVAKPAKKGMFSPVKSKPAQKIDGAIAGIIATSRACLTPEPKAEARVRWI